MIVKSEVPSQLDKLNLDAIQNLQLLKLCILQFICALNKTTMTWDFEYKEGH
jgi:hypothetical protein